MSNKNILGAIAKTDVGRLRRLNEDRYTISNNLSDTNWYIPLQPYANPGTGSIMAIADGMGGTNAGEVASEIAIESVKKYFHTTNIINLSDENILNTLIGAVLFSHQAILDYVNSHPETTGMGTTLVISWIINERLYVAWSGDSRCYYYRTGTGLKQVSKDHSFVQSLVDEEKITKAQAFYHPQSNIITQSLGDYERPPQPDVIRIDLQKNDIILMCSDGLNFMLRDDEIQEIIEANSSDINLCSDTLVAKANDAGGMDNITVVLVKVLETMNHIETDNVDFTSENINNSSIKRQGIKIKKNRRLTSIGLFFFLIAACLAALFLSVKNFSKRDPPANKARDTTQHDSGLEKRRPASKKESFGQKAVL